MNKSFTLIEILVVIVIIGIISGFIIVSMAGVSSKATVAKGQAFANSLKNSLMLNLVSEWKFDDGSGTQTSTADTWSGNNNGTLTNFNFNSTDGWRTGSECVSGSCLAFDGTDDFINCGTNANLKITGSITISAWVKPSVLATDNRVFANFTYMQNGYAMNIYDTGAFYFATWQASAAQQTTSSTGAVTTGSWNYLVATRSGTTAKTYRNGVNVTASSGSHIDPLPSTVSARIGINGGWPFNGLIDEIRIYNEAVPAYKIQEDYYSGLNKLFESNGIALNEYNQRTTELKSNLANNE